MLKPFLAIALIAAVSAPIAARAAGPVDDKRGIQVVPRPPATLVAAPQGIVAEPQGTAPGAGAGKQSPGRPSTGEVFIVRPPEGAAPSGRPRPQTAGRSEPVTPFVVRPPQGFPSGNGGSVLSRIEPVAPAVSVPALASDFPPEIAAPPAAMPETLLSRVGSAADLYQALTHRGFGVSILHRDRHERYVFLVTPRGKRYAHLVLVDGPSGEVLRQRTFDLTKLQGGHRGRYHVPSYREVREFCRSDGKVRYGSQRYASTRRVHY